MELILNTEEQEFLQDILEQRHRELLKEISHTDSREFKQDLRKKEMLLDSILSRLRRTAIQELRA
ncbi:MAG: ubiquinol-cytochrome-c reductase complex assembly factor 3 [Acidobacteriia bacterium]|nr:ubiquinol-cytochrome-c reductase complex assembly factor 3 [Terriglobia bacterium]